MSVDLSVVVAVYNEEPDNLVHLLERLWTAIAPLKLTYEVVFVDDGSREPTYKALKQIATEVTYVKLVVLSRNFGQQAAISAGFDHAEGLAIVNIDSDCQDPPELIPDMVKLWREGYDVVYAQRSSRRDRFSKRFTAFLFYRTLGLLSSVNIPWDTGDFRLIDRKVLSALQSMPEKTRFLRGQIPWLGFRQIGIPIKRDARELGQSTYTVRKLLTLAIDGLLAFSVTPLYLVAVLGVLMSTVGVGLLGWLLVASALGQAVAQNMELLAAFLALSGLQITCTGCVAVYLSKVLDEVRSRPTYVVGERLGLPFARGEFRADFTPPTSSRSYSDSDLSKLETHQ